MAIDSKIKLIYNEQGIQHTDDTWKIFNHHLISIVYNLISKIRVMYAPLSYDYAVTFARTKTLSVEKKRTNQLLYQMLPKAVAEKLKNNQHVEPILFKSATVLFSDIVGFTALSAKSSPVQVTHYINLYKMYVAFFSPHVH